MHSIEEFAAKLATLVDELVYSVHRRARADHGEQLQREVQSLGVEDHGLAGIAPELQEASGISKMKFERRFRYASDERRRAFLDEFQSKGLLIEAGEALVAAPPLRAYLEHLEEARAAAATALWDEDAAGEIADTVSTVLRAAPRDFQLTADLAEVPDGSTPEHRLFNLLSKLRYVRADAHYSAWSDHGMTAAEMVQLTARWREQEPRPDPAAVSALTERGLVHDDRLTAEGIQLREMIEEDTNLHNGRALQVLSEAERAKLLAQLQALTAG